MKPKIIRKLARAGRHYGPTWRYVFNLYPTLSYQIDGSRLSDEASRVVGSLNRDGVAKTSVAALLGPESCYDELFGHIRTLQLSLHDEIKAAEMGADEHGAIGNKKFIFEYLGRNPQFAPEAVYARFALERNILGVANRYLGMFSRLRYYNVWHTFPTSTEARESQLWHRDREDFLIVKVFVYLSDVDESAGPFTYARGTHPKGQVRQEAACFVEGGVNRSTDEQMSEVLGPKDWFYGVGPKGTIIFADTRGYHRGGLARTRPRVMYTAMFTSAASQSEDFMVDGPAFTLPHDKQQAFAVSGRRS